MAIHSRRSSSTSTPTIRLSQPLLPPLISLKDFRTRDVSQITVIPYHDNSSEDVDSPKSRLPPETLPPTYEPMYDYLRSQQRPVNLLLPSRQSLETGTQPEEPYRDEPFAVTIDHDLSEPPPPSYEELYLEDHNRRALQDLLTEFGDDSVPAEEICKFIVAMIIIALTIACVGIAFNWERIRW